MKKAFILSLYILLLCSLFAKGINENSDFIGVVVYRFDDTFISDVRTALQAISKDRMPVRIVDSQHKQSIQNDAVADFLSNDSCKAVIINSVDRTSSGLLIEKAKKNDIPLIFFNREPLKGDMDRWDKVYYVGADARVCGEMCGNIFLEYYSTHPEIDRNGDGIIQYIMIKGEAGHQDTELRTEYTINTILRNGIKVERLNEDTGNWQKSGGYSVMEASLASFGDRIEVVFANNDDMALGAIEALKEHGYFENGKYMPVIGVDGTDPGRAALEEGTLLGTVYNDSYKQAEAIYNIAYELASGRIPTSDTIGYDIENRCVWISYVPLQSSTNKSQ